MSERGVGAAMTAAPSSSSSRPCRVRAPALLIGEFDAMVGPAVSYASECFDVCDGGGSVVGACVPPSLVRVGTRRLTLVDGDVAVGRHVATGALHHSVAAHASTLAARVLTSSEAREQSVVYCDGASDVAIGGVAFTLPDILARGEVRRFCLLFVYTRRCDDDNDDGDDACDDDGYVVDTLVQRWPLCAAVARVLIASWTTALEERRRREYNTMADLERVREHARRRPLRSLMTLLAADGDGDGEGRALLRVHALLDSVLPLVYGDAAACDEARLLRGTRVAHVAPLHTTHSCTLHDDTKKDTAQQQQQQQEQSTSCSDRGSALVTALQQLLCERVPLAQQCVVHVHAHGAVLTVLPQPATRTMLMPSDVPLPTRPLAAWLVDCLRAASAQSPTRDKSGDGDANGGTSHRRGGGDDSHDELSAFASATAATAAMQTLLCALFSGKQLVIVAADARAGAAHECADLVLALAAALPRSLASYRVYADVYVMPYTCRLISFTDAYMNAHHNGTAVTSATATIATASAATTMSTCANDNCACSAEGVVHVLVADKRIVAVYDGDEQQERERNTVATPHTTLTQRMVNLVCDAASARDGDGEACHGLDLQLRQLVREYVLRGCVYRALYREQEVRANSAVLDAARSRDSDGKSVTDVTVARVGPHMSSAAAATQHGLVTHVTRALQQLGVFASEARAQLRGTPLLTYNSSSSSNNNNDSGVGADASGDDNSAKAMGVLRKHATLSAASSTAFMRDRYVFCSAAAEDHSILVFLGCAAGAM